MERPPKIIIGSKSRHKIEAVRGACDRFWPDGEIGIVGVETNSGVNEQPVGLSEIRHGARNRADSAWEQTSDPKAWTVGIESGIVFVDQDLVLDFAIVTLRFPDGRYFWATSTGIAFPMDCVIEAQEKGFEETKVGGIISARRGGSGTDPHAILTAGWLGREETLMNAVYVLFAQAAGFMKKPEDDVDPDASVSVSGLCKRHGIIIDDPDINDENFPPVFESELDRVITHMLIPGPMKTEEIEEQARVRGLEGAILQAHIYAPQGIGSDPKIQRLIAMGSPFVKSDGETYFPCVTRDGDGALHLTLTKARGEDVEWDFGDVFHAWPVAKKT